MAQIQGLNIQTVRNIKFSTSFSRENIEFALNYKPLDTDKFVVSYPKSGTTWAQQIICLIVNDGIPQKSDREYIFNSYIEMMGNISLNTSLNPRVIKTHLPFDSMPYNKSAKYLCVSRNPKDTCVSFYHHIKKRYPEYHGDFHDFFNYWIKGELYYINYFEHVLSHWSHRFDDNYIYLTYEQMKNNPRDAILKVAQFLGEEFVVKLKENNELILKKVMENSTFESMKSSQNHEIYHVRKGIVGDWRNHFTKAESDLVDEKVKEMFTGTGLDELWAEEMKW